MTKQATALERDLAAMPTANRKKSQCLVGDAMTDPETGAIVKKFVEDLRYSAPALARTLAKHNITISCSSIRNHRGARCACVGVGG